MIALALGKKGAGKTALIRKIAARVHVVKRPIFYHDPQHQIDAGQGKVYTSAAEWVCDPAPAYLSIFRECEVEEPAELAIRLRDVTLVVDEMDRACNAKKWLAPSVRKIVHEGRHYRVSLLGTFRRTTNVSEDLLSQVDYVFLFRTSPTSPGDIVTIRHRFGEAVAERVQTLEDGQFTVWRDGA